MGNDTIRVALNGGLRVAAMAIALTMFTTVADAQEEKTPSPLEEFVSGKTDLGEGADERLQGLLLAFADYYSQTVSTLRTQVPDEGLSPRMRAGVYNAIFGQAYLALRTANDPNPRAALVELVSLIAAEQFAVSQVAPDVLSAEFAEEVIRMHDELLERAWLMAGRFLDEPQLADLRASIEKWKANNQEIDTEDFTAALDLAAVTGIGPAVRASGGGLLGIGAATQAVDQARILGERALHMLERMPVVIGWLAELTYFRLAATPEIQEVREHLTKLTPAIVNLSATAETLPAVLERERTALLGALESQQSGLKGLLDETRATLDAAAPLLEGTRATLGTLEQVVTISGDLTSRVDALVQRPELQQIDLPATRALVGDLNVLVEGLNKAVQGTERLAGGAGVDPFSRLQSVGVTLILVLCVAAFVTGVAFRVVSARLPPRA